MEDGWKNGVVEDVVVVEEGEVHANVEAAGGLKTRSRKNRLLEKGGEVEGDAAVAGENERGVYLVQEEGVKSLDETNGVGLKEVEQLLTNKNLPNCETDCTAEKAEDFSAKENHYDHEDLKMKNHEICEEECGRTLTGTEARSENIEQVALPQESEVAVEMDLERILEEQETHDLYCPNCHSCITKRVILRKRKRTARVNLPDAKLMKIEPVQDDLIATTSAAETTGETNDKEPDVFRCLSCLSFFIPTDTGFRLFHVFGKREENGNIQSSQQLSGRNQNWLFSLIDLMMGKNKGSKLDYKMPDKETDTISPALGELTPSTFQAIIEENLDAKGDYQSDKEGSQISLGSNLQKDDQMNIGENLANGTKNEIARNEVNKVSLYNPPSEWVGHLPDEERISAVRLTEQWPINISDIGRQVEHVDQESIKDVQVPENNIMTSLFEKIKIKEEKLQVPKEGGTGDGIISVEEGMIKPIQEICLKGPPLRDLRIPIPVVPDPQVQGETHIHLEETMAKTIKTHQWDVLKAIVYGGLLESIASLGVISSAAGSDVTTLNVMALGLANLVSGLLVVIHNLVGLKNEQYKSINRKEEADRYWELLGTRGHFKLHATVVLLSYILVGALPVIIYGFSFRKSDNKEYKMIVVAAASLFCIALLAIAKAHVQEGQKTYVKTFLYYIGLGIVSSGLSYAIGMLVKKLLEKLGLFDDTVVVPSPPLPTMFEVASRTPSWQSF